MKTIYWATAFVFFMLDDQITRIMHYSDPMLHAQVNEWSTK